MVHNKDLRNWLEGFKYEDFHNGKIEGIKDELNVGDYFITDYLGNELSLCKVIKNRSDVSYWKDAIKLVEVLIPNCSDKYGSSINGPFLVPEKV